MVKLSETQLNVLRLAVAGKDLYDGVCRDIGDTSTRQQRTGRKRTIRWLRLHSLLAMDEITYEGRQYIGVFRHCSKCGLGEGEFMACEEPDCGTLQ